MTVLFRYLNQLFFEGKLNQTVDIFIVKSLHNTEIVVNH